MVFQALIWFKISLPCLSINLRLIREAKDAADFSIFLYNTSIGTFNVIIVDCCVSIYVYLSHKRESILIII